MFIHCGGGQHVLPLQPAEVVDHQPCLGHLDPAPGLQVLDRRDDRVALRRHRVLQRLDLRHEVRQRVVVGARVPSSASWADGRLGSSGEITVKNVFSNRCGTRSSLTAMFANELVNASMSLSIGYGSQFALDMM